MSTDIQRLSLTPKDKKIIGLKCINCNALDNLEYHHVVPLALGGSNLLTNIVCLCSSCHKTIHSGVPGISYGHLGMIRERRPRKPREEMPKFDITLFAQLIVRYQNHEPGLTKIKIAEQLGISRPTLDTWMNKGYYQKAQEIIKSLDNS